MKRINLSALLAAQEAWDKEKAIGFSSALPPPQRVTRTGSSYNSTCPSSHSPFQPPPTSSSCYHLQSAIPLGGLTQIQYFDLPAPPSAPLPQSCSNSLLSSFPFPIYIDPHSDEEENDNMVDIKATLSEEFSKETRDANRWLMAMGVYFTLHMDKFPDEAWTVVFFNMMSKGQGKAFAKAWLIKLEDEHIVDADKNWTKIRKAFKAAFTPYDIAAQAQVTLTLLNQDQKNPSGFDKYISSFFLLSVHSGITNYHALLEWFLHSLNTQIAVQLTLYGAIKATIIMEELYSKASEIEGSYCHIITLRKGPQPSYGEGGYHHNPNTMDMDHLMLFPVKHTCHMCENYCFICHKEDCSTRNHPNSWFTNLKPSKTAQGCLHHSPFSPYPLSPRQPLGFLPQECHQDSRTWLGTPYLKIHLQ